ncbi:PadR family transcriptional regulator [Sphingomonas sp. ID0503]|uniref:PadR family transcriptional regulator n=1 Tax=Sphingomonas sp. ID0503 TaxID=3399691 RepID=UPI003AFB2AF7
MFSPHHHHHHRGHGRHGHGERGQHFGPRDFGGGFGRRFGGDEERGGRRRRVFDGGQLKLVVLKLIGDTPRHGYDVIRAIEELSGGAYAPSPGVIYPTLTLLEDMGHIAETEAEGSRRAFAITPEGTAHLDERRAEVDALIARLGEIAAVRERTDGAVIRRAMGNLKSVLMHRLNAGDVTKDTLHDVAAIIDDAAQRIERL